MKPLLIIITCIFCIGSSVHGQDLQKSLERYRVISNGTYKLDSLKKYIMPVDTIRLPMYKNNMPNAFKAPFPSPRLLGNTGQGNNIYLLPLDNMPMIKPDSTFVSNMPVAGKWSQSRSKN